MKLLLNCVGNGNYYVERGGAYVAAGDSSAEGFVAAAHRYRIGNDSTVVRTFRFVLYVM